MAGYTRQSTFADGDTITAALFNNEYNQLVNAFSNTTGHSHDGTAASGPVIGLIGDAGETSPNNKVVIDTTNNYIEFYVEVSSAPVQQLYIADGAIIPVTDSDIDLGTTALRFKDAYIDSITTTGNISVGGNITVTGDATISGNLTFGDADTDTIILGADVASHITPDVDDTYDLGSSTKEWRNLYIDGTANIDSLVADTADIDGGTIDGATIATSDITVGTGKTLDVSSGTLTLADNQISGDKVEGGTIAATTITDLTFGSLNDGTITVTAFVDEDNMVSDSATLIPTQQSVKAYVDSQVTAQDLDFQGDTGGALSIDLDSESLTIAGGTGLDTVGSGNTVTINIDSTVATLTGSQTLTNKTIDVDNNTVSNIEVDNLKSGVLDTDLTSVAATDTTLASAKAIKTYVDSQVTAQDLDFQGDTGGALSIDLDSESLTIAGGTGIDTVGASNTLTVAIDSTVATLTGTQTLTNKTLTSPVLNTSISGTAFLDDDTFATASATTLASSESIKAYVDARILTEDTLAELNDTNITSPADGALLFYDTGTSMWIDNVVSGDITIADTGVAAISSGVIVNDDINASAAISISKTALVDGTGLTLTGDTLSVDAAQTQITSVGTLGSLTVSGDLTVDTSTLKVDSTNNRVGILNATPDVTLDIGSATDAIHMPVGTTAQRPTGAAGYFRYNSDLGQFEGYTDSWGSIAGSGGGGTAPSLDTMTGDGSDTTLTLSTSPINENATFVTIDGVLQHKDTYSISGNTLTFSEAPPSGSKVESITLTTTTSTTANILSDADADTKVQVEKSSDEDKIRFDTGGTERMIIDSTGVGINTSSPSTALEVNNASAGATVATFEGTYSGSGDVKLASFERNGGAVAAAVTYADAATAMEFGTTTSHSLILTTGDTERMRITSAGGLEFQNQDFSNIGTIYATQYLANGDTDTGIVMQGSNVMSFHTGNSERARFDASGNFGIGETSPDKILHLKSSGATGIVIESTTNAQNLDIDFYNNSGSAQGRIRYAEGAGSFGFAPNVSAGDALTIDYSGDVKIFGTIGANSSTAFASMAGRLTFDTDYSDTQRGPNKIVLQEDGSWIAGIGISNGATDFYTGGDFTFRTGTSLGSERMRINSGGNVYFGVSSEPTGSTGGSAFVVDSVDRMNLILATTSTGNIDVANFRNPNGTVGKINTNGSSTVYNTSSDARLKDVTGSARGLEVINELNPVSYNWKVDGKADEGLIAQEVLDIVPNAVSGSEEEQYYMDYSKLVVHLVKGMKEQQEQIEALQSEINLLKGE